MKTTAKLALTGIIVLSLICIIDFFIESTFHIKLDNSSFDFNDFWAILFKRTYLLTPIGITAYVFIGLFFLKISHTSKDIKTGAILAASGMGACIIANLSSLVAHGIGFYHGGIFGNAISFLSITGLSLTIPFFITFVTGRRKEAFATPGWLAIIGISLRIIISLLWMFVYIYGYGLAPLLITYLIGYSAYILCIPFFFKLCKTADTAAPVTPTNTPTAPKKPIVSGIPMRKPK